MAMQSLILPYPSIILDLHFEASTPLMKLKGIVTTTNTSFRKARSMTLSKTDGRNSSFAWQCNPRSRLCGNKGSLQPKEFPPSWPSDETIALPCNHSCSPYKSIILLIQPRANTHLMKLKNIASDANSPAR